MSTNVKKDENKSLGKSINFGKLAADYNYILIFAAILIVYLILSAGGITLNGVMNILRHSSVVGIMALGMGIVIITKGIDLSIGSMLALVGGVSIVVFNQTNSILLTLIVCLLGGILCGFMNGILIGKAKLPPFIVTLATMLIFRSLSQYLCRLATGSNLFRMLNELSGRDILYKFGQSYVFKIIPTTGVILIAVTVIMVLITTQTKFGKAIFAVGSNEKAALLAGINVDWLVVSMYTITGLLVGIGAFLSVSMTTMVDPATLGKSNEMYAIAAVVIGGISMSGGKGKVLGIIFGAMSYTIIDKIIVSLGLDALINDTIKGAILLIAIAIQIATPAIKAKINEKQQKRNLRLESEMAATETAE